MCCFWCFACVSSESSDVWFCVSLRLAESRSNPQVLDIGVNPQDYNPEECLSPSNWDRADAEAAEDAFGFWADESRPLLAAAGTASQNSTWRIPQKHRPKQYSINPLFCAFPPFYLKYNYMFCYFSLFFMYVYEYKICNCIIFGHLLLLILFLLDLMAEASFAY